MAIHGLVAGTLVVCSYRMPSPLQPWIAQVAVGVVEEPGDDPAAWNGANSERAYCKKTGKVPVRYGETVLHDSANCLQPITAEEAAMSHPEQVLRFLGEEALRNLVRGGSSGGADVLARHQGYPVLTGRPRWLDQAISRHGLAVDEQRRRRDGKELAIYSGRTPAPVWEFRHRATEQSGFGWRKR